MNRFLLPWILLLCLTAPAASAFARDTEVSLFDRDIVQLTGTPSQPSSPSPAPVPAAAGDVGARAEFIDLMIGLAESLFKKAGGRPQRASSAGDIYVCKNFTVYLFRQNRDSFRMAEFPDVELRIPNNLPAAESRPYSYGIAWEDLPAQEGNPFFAANSFYYDSKLTHEENREKAMAFMRGVQRGDFFQMSANYYYGIGAHSAVFIADYDPATNEVTWTDSNMKGETRGGVRYGYVQYGVSRDIGWFVDAFCQKGRGATLYRLREDIVRR